MFFDASVWRRVFAVARLPIRCCGKMHEAGHEAGAIYAP